MKYIANLLLAVHTVAAAEAMALARRSGLDLELVQKTLDNSIASSAIWKQRGPVMAERAWSPAPGPVRTLHPILEQIEDYAAHTVAGLVIAPRLIDMQGQTSGIGSGIAVSLGAAAIAEILAAALATATAAALFLARRTTRSSGAAHLQSPVHPPRPRPAQPTR